MRIVMLILLAPALAGCAMGDSEANVESVELTEVPEAAQAGEDVEVCWQVEGSGDIGHVALHWGQESHTGEETRFSDYENLAWPDNEQRESYGLPDEFCTTFTMPDGEVYLRGHAMIDPPGVLSEEASITA